MNFSFNSRISFGKAFIYVAGFLCFFALPNISFGETLYMSDNFDSYATGTLNGKGSWVTTGTAYTVSTSFSQTAPNSGKTTMESSGRVAAYNSTDIVDPTVPIYIGYNIYVGASCTNVNYAMGTMGASIPGSANVTMGTVGLHCKSGDNTKFQLSYDGDIAHVFYEGSVGSWHQIVVKMTRVSSVNWDTLYYVDSLLEESRLNVGKTSGSIDEFNMAVNATGGGVTGNWYLDDIVISDTKPLPLGIDTTSSHIVQFSPAHGAVMATTTIDNKAVVPITGEVYISADDISFIQGVTVEVTNEDNNYFLPITETNLSYDFNDDLEVGLWDFAVNTDPLPIGNYTVHVRLNTNYLGGVIESPFSAGYNWATESIDSTNPKAQYHQYVVVQGTTLGNLSAQTSGIYEDILNSGGESSIEDCNILSGFDFGGCVTYAFVPNKASLQSFGTSVYNNILIKFPFGYGTRFYTILTASVATTSLPQLSATIPAGYPAAGATLNLSPWGKLMGSTSWLGTATSTLTSGKTFYQTFQEYWTFFIYFCFGLGVILEVISMNEGYSFSFGGGGGGRGGSKNPTGLSKKDQELKKRGYLTSLEKEIINQSSAASMAKYANNKPINRTPNWK